MDINFQDNLIQNQCQCKQCKDVLSDTLELFIHKKRQCSKIDWCHHCGSNLGLNQLTLYLLNEISKDKEEETKIPFEIKKETKPNLTVFDDFFNNYICVCDDSDNKGLTLREMWRKYQSLNESEDKILPMKCFKQFLCKKGFKPEQGTYQGKHQRYLWKRLKFT